MNTTSFNFMSSVANMIYVCDKSPIVVDKSPAFKAGMITLGTKYTEAQLMEVLLEGKTPGITTDYMTLKTTASTTFGVVTSVVSGYGATVKNGVLIAMKSINYSYLLGMAPEKLEVKLDEILNVLDTNATGLLTVGITPALVLELKALRASVHTDKDKTKHAIKLHNETLELYEAKIAEMKVVITTILDPCSKFFKLGDVPFYLAYKNARKIAHHHIHNKVAPTPDTTTGILALTVNDALTGLPKPRVKLEVPSINYEILTDENGEAANENMVPDTYTGKLSCVGCVDIDFTFKITKAQITEMGFMMENLS